MDSMCSDLGGVSAVDFGNESVSERREDDAPASAPVSPIPWYVVAAQQGDPEGFRVLFQTHRGLVLQLLRRMLGQSPEVEDVLQEVFLQVHRGISRFRGQSQFKTWLFRVVYNVTAMHLRARRSRPVLCAFDPERPDPAAPRDAVYDPYSAFLRNERLSAVAASLEGLSERKREVFLMHDVNGISAGRIAELTDTPVLTVRSRLFNARKQILGALRRRAL